MGVSFRMDGWLGNSGFQPDGEGAVGTGRASIGGIRSLQSTQSRKSTSSIDSIEKIDSIDRLSRLSRLNRLNREKNADERSGPFNGFWGCFSAGGQRLFLCHPHLISCVMWSICDWN